MVRFIIPMIRVAWLSTASIGGAAIVAEAQSNPGPVLGESTLFSLGVVGLLVVATWWVRGKLDALSTQIGSMAEKEKDTKEKIVAISTELSHFNRTMSKLNNLECLRHGSIPCPREEEETKA